MEEDKNNAAGFPPETIFSQVDFKGKQRKTEGGPAHTQFPTIVELYQNRKALMALSTRARMVLHKWNSIRQQAPSSESSFANDINLANEFLQTILDRWEELQPIAKGVHDHWIEVLWTIQFLERNYPKVAPLFNINDNLKRNSGFCAERLRATLRGGRFIHPKQTYCHDDIGWPFAYKAWRGGV